METRLWVAVLFVPVAGLVLGLVIAAGSLSFVSGRRLASGREELGTFAKLLTYLALAAGGAVAGVLLDVLLVLFLVRTG